MPVHVESDDPFLRTAGSLADADSQLIDEQRFLDSDEVQTRVAQAWAATALSMRLTHSRGERIALLLSSGWLRGRLADCGPDWVLVSRSGEDVVCRVSAVSVMSGLAQQPVVAVSASLSLSWRTALRPWIDREVVVELADSVRQGVLVALAQDHIDLRTTERLTIPWAGVDCVRQVRY